MKIRTWLAGSSALAVAALSAAALVPVASDAATTLVKGGKPAGCAVTLDGDSSKHTLTAPVMKSVLTSYAASAALADELYFSSTGITTGCGSLSIVMYGTHNGAVDSTPLQSRTVSLSGISISPSSALLIDSLIAEIPTDNDSGPCLASQIEMRDTNGTVVQVAPVAGPVIDCAGEGGGFTYGG